MENILKNIEPVRIEKPSDVVLKQIKNIISTGELKPGDKLPPERILAERFGIGRGYIREAIKRLEYYGILKTIPQSGTLVANLGVSLINGLIASIIQLEKDDFRALIETRSILEIEACRLAALRANKEEFEKLDSLFCAFKDKVMKGMDGLEEDLLFHLHIADMAGNQVLRSIIMLITPEVAYLSKKLDTCKEDRTMDALSEHQAILEAIREKNSGKAAAGMKIHMDNTMRTVKYED